MMQMLELDAEYFKRMELPVKLWDAKIEEVLATVKGHDISLREALENYLANWSDIWERGIGLLISGPNGVGKTFAAGWLGKEFRRRNKSVLFAIASQMFDRKVSRELWPHRDPYTYWQWANKVSVLILDDLGKGSDAGGHVSIMWDELIRVRSLNKLVTIITTNLSIHKDKSGSQLASALKLSTLNLLQEEAIALTVEGVDRRQQALGTNIRLIHGC